MSFSGQARPASLISQSTHTSNNDILLSFSNVLQRLETHLEGQNARLDSLETYIRSGAASPVSDRAPSPEATPASASGKQLPRLPKASFAGASSASTVETPAALYEASIRELQKQFLASDINKPYYEDSMDKECRSSLEVERNTTEPVDSSNLKPASGIPAMRYDDAYSVSVYPSELYARSDADVPPVPPLTATTPTEHRHGDELGPLESSVPYSIIPPAPEVMLGASSLSPVSRSSSLRFWKNRLSRSSLSSSQSLPGPRPPHERVEMAYRAYDNFLGSFASSAEKRAKRDEFRRLDSLGRQSAKTNSGWWRGQGIFGFLSGLSRITSKRPSPQLVYFVS